jgi:hypothetical protein
MTNEVVASSVMDHWMISIIALIVVCGIGYMAWKKFMKKKND